MPIPKGFTERKIKPARRCAVGSIRTKILSKTKRVIICCPVGQWQPRKERCKVGTVGVAIQTKKTG